MTIKQTLGENTEKIEQKAKKLQDRYYSNLEPWQRGLVLLGILAATIAIIYLLNHDNKEKTSHRKEQLEAEAEVRLLRRMELLKKLKE